MNKEITLRPASMEDAETLLEWRNDPDTRKASHSTEEVDRSEHFSWFSRTLKNTDRKLYVAEKDGDAIGTVRADVSNGVWELSWTIAPKLRGRGLAKTMVSLLAKNIKEPVCAEVKAENTASAKIAEYAGMTLQSEKDGVLYYFRAAF